MNFHCVPEKLTLLYVNEGTTLYLTYCHYKNWRQNENVNIGMCINNLQLAQKMSTGSTPCIVNRCILQPLGAAAAAAPTYP